MTAVNFYDVVPKLDAKTFCMIEENEYLCKSMKFIQMVLIIIIFEFIENKMYYPVESLYHLNIALISSSIIQ